MGTKLPEVSGSPFRIHWGYTTEGKMAPVRVVSVFAATKQGESPQGLARDTRLTVRFVPGQAHAQALERSIVVGAHALVLTRATPVMARNARVNQCDSRVFIKLADDCCGLTNVKADVHQFTRHFPEQAILARRCTRSWCSTQLKLHVCQRLAVVKGRQRQRCWIDGRVSRRGFATNS
jgi:hypothetical protein